MFEKEGKVGPMLADERSDDRLSGYGGSPSDFHRHRASKKIYSRAFP